MSRLASSREVCPLLPWTSLHGSSWAAHIRWALPPPATRRWFDLEATMTSLARSRRAAVAVAAAAAAVLVCVSPATAGAQPQLTATFTEDFNGAAGRAANSSRWNYETGDNVNNHERQWYTSGAANGALDGNGHLVITAKKE